MGNIIYTLCCSCKRKKNKLNNLIDHINNDCNLNNNSNYNLENKNKHDKSLYTPLLTKTLPDEYKSLNTVDPFFFSNIDDVRLKPSNFININNNNPDDIYTYIEDIGEGSYGYIIKVKHNLTKEIRAMKIIEKSRLIDKDNEAIISDEIKILKSLDHPNIIKIYEFFSDKYKFYIVMEYLELGDLFSFFKKLVVDKNKNKDLKQTNCYFLNVNIRSIIKQLLSALTYLHTKNIIHGDIKLENILITDIIFNNRFSYINKMINNKNANKKSDNLNSLFINNSVSISKINLKNYKKNKKNNLIDKLINCNASSITSISIKLIDFGCSKYFKPSETKSELIGTAYYIAPEVLNNKYNYKCDIWSVGVVMYALLNEKPPFTGKNNEEIINNIKKGNINYNTYRLNNSSINLQSFLKKLLTYNYLNRVKAFTALKDPWLSYDQSSTSNNNILQVCNFSKINTDEEFNSIIYNSNNKIFDNIYYKAYIKLKKYSSYPKISIFKQAVLIIIAHNYINSKEANEYRDVFIEFDKDCDGRISKKDLLFIINIYENNKLSETGGDFNTYNKKEYSQLNVLADKIIQAVDFDKNGYIEYEEFIKAVVDLTTLLSDENLKYAFNYFLEYKKDHYSSKEIHKNNKFIDYNLIEKVLFDNKEVKPKIVADIMKSIGKNINETINLNEFKIIMKTDN